MSKIHLVATGFDVAPVLAQLKAHPELWDSITIRKDNPASPHREVQDIWVRNGPLSLYENDDGRADRSKQPFESVWYPAYRKLTALKPLIFDLMHLVKGERIGAIFITKIPPGAACHPHKDAGWHVENHDKYVIQLASHPRQAFHFENESLVTKPGDVFFFDNQHTHWVTNDSSQDRISLIVCIQSDRGA